jgi:hypothetical protein
MSVLLRLALCLGLALPGTQVLAHALPGTSLTIRADTERLGLAITMPLHELDLAMPDASGLGPDPAIGPMREAIKERIAGYLTSHLALQTASGELLDVRLTDARIERAHDDHVGAYDLLVIDLTAPAAVLPLTLRFDAIMHEVRSHRAAVYLQVPGSDPVGIGVMRIDPATGEAKTLTIPALP